jgi:WD40 repeat protein
VQQLRGHTDSIVQVLMSLTDGNCTLASASLDTMIRIWNLDSGDCLRVLQGHATLIRCISFSRDGSQLASGSDDGTVRLWNVASDACQVLRVPNAIQINTIKLAKTSLLTLTVDRQTNDYREDHPYSIRIWDIASKECLCNTPAARNTAFAFSNDGKYYSVTTADGDSIGCSASVFDMQTNQCISTMHGHSRAVRSIVFSLCGNSVATTSDDKTIAIWSLIDFVGLCQIVLPMLESGVAPYVALDIVDFLLAAAATHASFASRSEFMHFRKISVVDALRQRMKEKLVLSRE